LRTGNASVPTASAPEALITDLPEDKPAAPPMPHGDMY